MTNRSGLRKITKSVRGRKGSVRRSYWVRAKEGAGRAAEHVKQFAKDHSGKIIAGAALGAGAVLAYKHRASFTQANATKHWNAFRKGAGARLGEHLVNAAGTSLLGLAASQAGKFAGKQAGKIGGKRARQATKFLVRETVEHLGGEYVTPRVARSARDLGKRIRTLPKPPPKPKVSKPKRVS